MDLAEVERERRLEEDGLLLLGRQVGRGRDLAVSVVEGSALPVVEAVPQEEDFYDFESRYEIGRTTFVCPAELPEPVTARAQALAVATYVLVLLVGAVVLLRRYRWAER